MSKKRMILISATVVTLLLILSVSIAFANGVGSVNGGGQIYEAPDGAKRPEWNVVSFGGWVQKSTVITGEWQVNFHNVGDDDFDKSHFHTTDIQTVKFYAPDSGTCNAAFNMYAVGEWNGNPGYSMWFRAGDFGSPGNADTIRVTLYAPGVAAAVYDTHTSTEFKDESSCVGSARTGLDAGNITIVRP